MWAEVICIRATWTCLCLSVLSELLTQQMPQIFNSAQPWSCQPSGSALQKASLCLLSLTFSLVCGSCQLSRSIMCKIVWNCRKEYHSVKQPCDLSTVLVNTEVPCIKYLHDFSCSTCSRLIFEVKLKYPNNYCASCLHVVLCTHHKDKL